MAPFFDADLFGSAAKAAHTVHETPKPKLRTAIEETQDAANAALPPPIALRELSPDLTPDNATIAGASDARGLTYSRRPFAKQRVHAEFQSGGIVRPSPQEAIVKLAVAKLHLRERAFALDRARVAEPIKDLREPLTPPDIEPKLLPEEEAATLELNVVDNAVAEGEASAAAEVAFEVKAAAEAEAETEAEAAALTLGDASIDDLDASEAAAVTGDLDAAVAIAIDSGAPGSAQLVNRLEAEEGAIEDAQIRAEDRKRDEERRVAYEQAQQQLAERRALAEAEVHTFDVRRSLKVAKIEQDFEMHKHGRLLHGKENVRRETLHLQAERRKQIAQQNNIVA